EVTLPVYVMPGKAEGSVVIPLGYGRTIAGRAGDGTGWNVYTLRTGDAPWRIPSVNIKRAKGQYEFACTSDHFQIDKLGQRERERRGEELVRETSFARHAKQPEEAAKPHHATAPIALW